MKLSMIHEAFGLDDEAKCAYCRKPLIHPDAEFCCSACKNAYRQDMADQYEFEMQSGGIEDTPSYEAPDRGW